MASDAEPPRSKVRWLLLLAGLTVLAIGAGGGGGLFMISKIEKAVAEKQKIEEEQVQKVVAYDASYSLANIGTVVTNLANPSDVWIRLEASIVLKTGTFPNPDPIAAEIRQDLLGYLHTLSVAQIEGPSGLVHLREDLTERVRLRSNGQVREFFIETLVIQ
ncbi:flagellar basal body-associated FliL family protein [Methylobacterium sp. E-066]|uniref:flagellar basal body-associated FliL family protein n=1 Tax=Methylobacterium sp. E-066 TaxID=2836584 RepID=UPI001FB94DCC|nr:flagellar basal body-associated FliL family protein [Methylobacterium sp. E-066]MCJ2140907.1 flagellar basal body-associated FliL family protein [Methylobacterium sp. E-066]